MATYLFDHFPVEFGAHILWFVVLMSTGTLKLHSFPPVCEQVGYHSPPNQKFFFNKKSIEFNNSGSEKFNKNFIEFWHLKISINILLNFDIWNNARRRRQILEFWRPKIKRNPSKMHRKHCRDNRKSLSGRRISPKFSRLRRASTLPYICLGFRKIFKKLY